LEKEERTVKILIRQFHKNPERKKDAKWIHYDSLSEKRFFCIRPFCVGDLSGPSH
jgi:hypothetical protein